MLKLRPRDFVGTRLLYDRDGTRLRYEAKPSSLPVEKNNNCLPFYLAYYYIFVTPLSTNI